MSEPHEDQHESDLDDLNPDGAGAGATPEEPSTFEPEEPVEDGGDGEDVTPR